MNFKVNSSCKKIIPKIVTNKGKLKADKEATIKEVF